MRDNIHRIFIKITRAAFISSKTFKSRVSDSDLLPWNLPARWAHIRVAKWRQRSNSLKLALSQSLHPFLLPLVPIQLRLNYGLLNKAATNALSCSPLLTFSVFLSHWLSGWKELAKLLCPRHQLATTQVPLNNINMSQTLRKLALLVLHAHTHAHTKLTTVYVLPMTVTNLISCSKHLHLCQTKERGRDLIDSWGLGPAANRA